MWWLHLKENRGGRKKIQNTERRYRIWRAEIKSEGKEGIMLFGKISDVVL